MPCNLITGGFGFIGCYLARHLVGNGEDVVIFDIAPGSRLVDNIKGKFNAVRGDLTNWPQVFEAVKTNKVDTIYHLGSLLPPQSEENLWFTYQVNVTGTLNVLEAARILGVSSVIYTSSIATFGPGTPDIVDEVVVQQPVNMYGVAKVCSERLGEHYWRKHGVNFRGVRFPPVVGAGRTGAQPSGYTCRMIEESALGHPYSVYVTPEHKVPALYVKDAVRSLTGLKQADESKLKRRVYNMHGFLPAAKALANALLRHVPEAKIDFKPDQAILNFFKDWPERLDDSRAREEWDWQPLYDLDKTVDDFIAEIKSNPDIFK